MINQTPHVVLVDGYSTGAFYDATEKVNKLVRSEMINHPLLTIVKTGLAANQPLHPCPLG